MLRLVEKARPQSLGANSLAKDPEPQRTVSAADGDCELRHGKHTHGSVDGNVCPSLAGVFPVPECPPAFPHLIHLTPEQSQAPYGPT